MNIFDLIGNFVIKVLVVLGGGIKEAAQQVSNCAQNALKKAKASWLKPEVPPRRKNLVNGQPEGL